MRQSVLISSYAECRGPARAVYPSAAGLTADQADTGTVRRRIRSRAASLAALCTCLLSAGNACAESEITLYGEIDTGVTYANPVAGEGGRGRRWSVSSSNVAGNFVGLRGSEDLGGGASAIFTIEQGIDSSNGQAVEGQPMFVGLSHPVWGTLTLGLQYDAVNDFLAPLTLTGSDGGTYFAHPFDADNANASVLSSHSVKWASADWDGFRVGGQYSIDPERTDRSTWSIGAGYGAGALSLAAAYAQYADVAFSDLPEAGIAGMGSAGAQFSPVRVIASPPAGSDPASVADAARVARRVYGGGLNYILGPATFGAVYTHVRYDSVNLAPGVRAALDNYEVNARYDATPAVRLAAGFTHSSGTLRVAGQSQRAAWNQIGVHANYAMSRRTDLYAEGLHQRTMSGAPLAFVNGIGASGTDQMSVLAMGVRHRF
jgi:general bacterial porin, GBP family